MLRTHTNKPLNKKQFKEIVRARTLLPIDGDKRLYNLASGYWVYNDLLSDLRQSGWLRFAPGFKSGVYGHSDEPFCIKIMGMGIGEDPLYFCERGYYLEHERNMLAEFRDYGFYFAPEVVAKEESIDFLIKQAGVRPAQAEMRVLNNDLLIMERIPGVPFASQTGHHLNYDMNIAIFDDDLLQETVNALEALSTQLNYANAKGLLHNDPMPPNIIFSINISNQIEARLVDFELAQNLCKQSPDYVNNSVAELYRERDVPRNTHTGIYIKNLDQHLMEGGIKLVREIISTAKEVRSLSSALDGVSIGIPFIGGIEVNLGQVFRFFRKRN